MNSSVRSLLFAFHQLTTNQKTLIASKLSLFETEDSNQPDYERFRRAFRRARARGQLNALAEEVNRFRD